MSRVRRGHGVLSTFREPSDLFPRPTSHLHPLKMFVPSLRVGSWSRFPAPGATAISYSASLIAAGGEAWLWVWDRAAKSRPIASASAFVPASGKPRFSGDLVYWGAGWLDLRSGQYTRLKEAEPEIRPSDSERPYAYAWSNAGNRLAASFAASGNCRLTLYDPHDARRPIGLYHGPALPPSALWINSRTEIVAGFPAPQVFDATGTHAATLLIQGANIVAIESTEDERRLIVIDLNRAVHWVDGVTWQILDRWEGPWLTGAVSPDGRLAFMLDAEGAIHPAVLSHDRFVPLSEIKAPTGAIAIAIGDHELACTAEGELWRASWALE